MSSLARRSLRATAAVAGITVAGVGIAGPAVAAPAEPERPGTEGAAPAAPEAGSTPNVAGDLPTEVPELQSLPKLFTVEGTSVYTADHALPELPSEQLPTADDMAHIARVDPVATTDVEYRAAAPQDRDGAMQELDSTALFGDLPGRVLDATEGNDIRR